MDVSVIQNLDGRSEIEGQFVTQADWIPSFWNYLLGLDRNDLIAELIQNDLDQDATRTVISFEQDQLVCEGNGKPVDAGGWERLRMIQGAGDTVRAKRGKIGVKNHGLKTAFTIGDKIRLMSAGQAIVQTLHADGRDHPPYPGASDRPINDPQAPDEGCRVIVRYRDGDVEPQQGEASVLGAVREEEIEALFQDACASVPEQFVGIVSPEVAPLYEIVLRHWCLGEAVFSFSCTRPGKIVKVGKIELFRRHCTVSGTVSPLPINLREQAARRLVPLRGRLGERIADFFHRGKRFYVEVSWPIDRRGKPKVGTGRFRYPIGYPQASREACTGHGVHFNAPFVSDNARHGPAQNEATNVELRDACESLLVDAFARHVIPHWGPDGLNPLTPSPGLDDRDGAIRPLVSALAKRGAMPILSWREAAELSFKGNKQKAKQVTHLVADERGLLEGKRYGFLIPTPTWSSNKIHLSLSILCPRSEMQIDPRIHPDITGFLTDQKTSGFGEDFVTFDEEDVFCRMTGDGNERFDAIADLEGEFSKPFIACSYLDLIELALAKGEGDESKEDALIEALMLPDAHGQATSLRDLYSSAPLPSNVPGLRLPSVLHPDLAGHPLFRQREWRLPKYTMTQFLEEEALQTADEKTRRQFWQWLRRNERRVARRERPLLADLAIWPDENGSLRQISELCYPRSSRVGGVLADSIHRPHGQLRRSTLVSVGGRARTSTRRVPTEEEGVHWLNKRIVGFEIGEMPSAAAIEDLRRFEADLAILLGDKAVARLLKMIEVALPALAQDGSVQQRTALVMPGRSNDLLALPGRFLLVDQRHGVALDKLSPALREPTAAMLLAAFIEDPGNLSSLHARLKHFLHITEPDDDERRRLAEMPIIPVQGRLLPPSTLAFSDRRGQGDHWGGWKTRIPVTDLSQDNQRRYRDAGVTSASPDEKTSRAFFEWLSTQDQTTLRHHIPCVLRHILHLHRRRGSVNWEAIFTDVPFIPVKGRDGVELVSMRKARRPPVYRPDADDTIAKVITQKDPGVLLAISHVDEVREPISQQLSDLGIGSLRKALKEPVSVTGTGGMVLADKKVRDRFLRLRSSGFQRTFLKRLDELDVEAELVRHDWYGRLGQVMRICLANKVEARYRFRGKSYTCEIDAGFDPKSGAFWVRKDHGISHSSIYEAIARQLIFKPAAPRIHLLALERAVGMEIDDPTFGRPAGAGSDPDGDGPTAENTGLGEIGEDAEGDAETEAGEAIFGHSPFEPDPKRNIPAPSPISSRLEGTLPSSTSQDGASPPGEAGGRSEPTPKLEKEHVEKLKRDHYASHCQMCLCERPPGELAPKGSYIQWEEVRRRVVEAHHVNPKSGGGARHAGNLILLCKLHHDNFGRRIVRADVAMALRNDARKKSIRFGVNSEVRGRQIKLQIPDTGEIVELFFTNDHAEYWLTDV